MAEMEDETKSNIHICTTLCTDERFNTNSLQVNLPSVVYSGAKPNYERRGGNLSKESFVVSFQEEVIDSISASLR